MIIESSRSTCLPPRDSWYLGEYLFSQVAAAGKVGWIWPCLSWSRATGFSAAGPQFQQSPCKALSAALQGDAIVILYRRATLDQT